MKAGRWRERAGCGDRNHRGRRHCRGDCHRGRSFGSPDFEAESRGRRFRDRSQTAFHSQSWWRGQRFGLGNRRHHGRGSGGRRGRFQDHAGDRRCGLHFLHDLGHGHRFGGRSRGHRGPDLEAESGWSRLRDWRGGRCQRRGGGCFLDKISGPHGIADEELAPVGKFEGVHLFPGVPDPVGGTKILHLQIHAFDSDLQMPGGNLGQGQADVIGRGSPQGGRASADLKFPVLPIWHGDDQDRHNIHGNVRKADRRVVDEAPGAKKRPQFTQSRRQPSIGFSSPESQMMQNFAILTGRDAVKGRRRHRRGLFRRAARPGLPSLRRALGWPA